MSVVNLCVAGFNLAVQFGLEERHETIPGNYSHFLTDQTPDLLLHHHFESVPSLTDWELSFDTTGNWKILERDGELAFCFYSKKYGADPFGMVILDQESRNGEIFINKNYFPDQVPFPLMYPIGEIIFAHLIGQEGGYVIHACAVQDGRNGKIFAGHSGAGKSTLARLWSQQPGFGLLSDDRVILRKMDGDVRIYGTPWHGDANIVSSQSAVLDQVFILKHAHENKFTPIRPVDLAAQLLSRSFPPIWSTSSMAQMLELLEQVSVSVSGGEFGFTPDQRAVDLVLRME